MVHVLSNSKHGAHSLADKEADEALEALRKRPGAWSDRGDEVRQRRAKQPGRRR